VENFSLSGLRFPRSLVGALGVIKKSAAQADLDLGLLDAGIRTGDHNGSGRGNGGPRLLQRKPLRKVKPSERSLCGIKSCLKKISID
jgi:hypothetical protein